MHLEKITLAALPGTNWRLARAGVRSPARGPRCGPGPEMAAAWVREGDGGDLTVGDLKFGEVGYFGGNEWECGRRVILGWAGVTDGCWRPSRTQACEKGRWVLPAFAPSRAKRLRGSSASILLLCVRLPVTLSCR